MISRWPVDRTAGWLGAAFLITLLGSEAALSLPDEQAAAASRSSPSSSPGASAVRRCGSASSRPSSR
jgi:hypothetical protein